MFGGAAPNSYDDPVAKATDENLTGENWEIILNLCDKVSDEGSSGAHNVIASIIKRLTHRNPNVQLYTLSLAESISKNCGIDVHREIASRAFTQTLEKMVTDRNTHDKVRNRALELIAMWVQEFSSDESLGLMEECYNGLKARNYEYRPPNEPPPPAVDDEIRRKEEEELQRVLEMSMKDRGGRAQWEHGPSDSGIASGSSGYAPVVSSRNQTSQPPTTSSSVSGPGLTRSSSAGTTGSATITNIVTRVRALYPFEATEPGELGFEKGDVIKVVDRGYKDWWRGQLRGRTGIFPVNYVEALPEPTAAELARETEQEAAVFAQAVNVEKLLTLLRNLDPAKDNLADNEEIQELYRSSMALRPKIVKLIDKYSQKRADLVSMNETFMRARSIFERMMEESLARHSGVPYEDSGFRASYRQSTSGGAPPYGWNPNMYQQQAQYSVVAPAGGPPQGPGFAPSAQNQAPYPVAQPPYLVGQGHPPSGPASYGQGQQVPYDAASPQASQVSQPYPASDPQQHSPNTNAQYPSQQPAPSEGASVQPAYQAQVPASVPSQSYGASQYPPQQQGAQQQQQPAVQQQSPPQQTAQQQPPAPYAHAQQQAYGQSPYPTVNTQGPPLAQQPDPAALTASPVASSQPTEKQLSQVQVQEGYAPDVQPQPVQQQQQQFQLIEQQQPIQQQPELQTQQARRQSLLPQQSEQPHQASSTQQQQQGPPYVYDPKAAYPDPNVQAWAQYYANGGTDPAGAVYFHSVPGIKPAAAPTGLNAGLTSVDAQQQARVSVYDPEQAYGGAVDVSPGGLNPGAVNTQQASAYDTNTAAQPSSPTSSHPASGAVGLTTPVSAHATPSWVLPKRDPIGVKPPHHQFAGLSLNDGGN